MRTKTQHAILIVLVLFIFSSCTQIKSFTEPILQLIGLGDTLSSGGSEVEKALVSLKLANNRGDTLTKIDGFPLKEISPHATKFLRSLIDYGFTDKNTNMKDKSKLLVIKFVRKSDEKSLESIFPILIKGLNHKNNDAKITTAAIFLGLKKNLKQISITEDTLALITQIIQKQTHKQIFEALSLIFEKSIFGFETLKPKTLNKLMGLLTETLEEKKPLIQSLWTKILNEKAHISKTEVQKIAIALVDPKSQVLASQILEKIDLPKKEFEIPKKNLNALYIKSLKQPEVIQNTSALVISASLNKQPKMAKEAYIWITRSLKKQKPSLGYLDILTNTEWMSHVTQVGLLEGSYLTLIQRLHDWEKEYAMPLTRLIKKIEINEHLNNKTVQKGLKTWISIIKKRANHEIQTLSAKHTALLINTFPAATFPLMPEVFSLLLSKNLHIQKTGALIVKQVLPEHLNIPLAPSNQKKILSAIYTDHAGIQRSIVKLLSQQLKSTGDDRALTSESSPIFIQTELINCITQEDFRAKVPCSKLIILLKEPKSTQSPELFTLLSKLSHSQIDPINKASALILNHATLTQSLSKSQKSKCSKNLLLALKSTTPEVHAAASKWLYEFHELESKKEIASFLSLVTTHSKHSLDPQSPIRFSDLLDKLAKTTDKMNGALIEQALVLSNTANFQEKELLILFISKSDTSQLSIQDKKITFSLLIEGLNSERLEDTQLHALAHLKTLSQKSVLAYSRLLVQGILHNDPLVQSHSTRLALHWIKHNPKIFEDSLFMTHLIHLIVSDRPYIRDMMTDSLLNSIKSSPQLALKLTYWLTNHYVSGLLFQPPHKVPETVFNLVETALSEIQNPAELKELLDQLASTHLSTRKLGYDTLAGLTPEPTAITKFNEALLEKRKDLSSLIVALTEELMHDEIEDIWLKRECEQQLKIIAERCTNALSNTFDNYYGKTHPHRNDQNTELQFCLIDNQNFLNYHSCPKKMKTLKSIKRFHTHLISSFKLSDVPLDTETLKTIQHALNAGLFLKTDLDKLKSFIKNAVTLNSDLLNDSSFKRIKKSISAYEEAEKNIPTLSGLYRAHQNYIQFIHEGRTKGLLSNQIWHAKHELGKIFALDRQFHPKWTYLSWGYFDSVEPEQQHNLRASVISGMRLWYGNNSDNVFSRFKSIGFSSLDDRFMSQKEPECLRSTFNKNTCTRRDIYRTPHQDQASYEYTLKNKEKPKLVKTKRKKIEKTASTQLNSTQLNSTQLNSTQKTTLIQP